MTTAPVSSSAVTSAAPAAISQKGVLPPRGAALRPGATTPRPISSPPRIPKRRWSTSGQGEAPVAGPDAGVGDLQRAWRGTEVLARRAQELVAHVLWAASWTARPIKVVERLELVVWS